MGGSSGTGPAGHAGPDGVGGQPGKPGGAILLAADSIAVRLHTIELETKVELTELANTKVEFLEVAYSMLFQTC